MAPRRMPRPLENSLKKTVLKRLKQMYPEACVRKRHGSAYATAGDPDIYFLAYGVHVELELKAPGEAPTRLQTARLQAWKKAGAHVGVITTIAELESFLAELAAAGILVPAGSPGEPGKGFPRGGGSRGK